MAGKTEWVPCDREVLTIVASPACAQGRHDECNGWLPVAEAIEHPTPEQLAQKIVFCLDACHLVPGTGN
jgi:hypothetical protein